LVVGAFAAAAAAGVVHGAFSVYWAAGGGWLLSTLGAQLVDAFEGRRWLLYLVGAVKIGFALAPFIWATRGWPRLRVWRAGCWLGAAILIVWGGINTATGNLVLTGAIHPSGGYDHDAMVGHAWLWDPLFLLWGAFLTAGLAATSVQRPSSKNAQAR
jgi:hypothetical protein